MTFHSSSVSLAHSLSLPTPLHSYWGRMGWGHQGRFETSQEIHHKSELRGGEISHTASGIILHVQKRVECVGVSRQQLQYIWNVLLADIYSEILPEYNWYFCWRFTSFSAANVFKSIIKIRYIHVYRQFIQYITGSMSIIDPIFNTVLIISNMQYIANNNILINVKILTCSWGKI